MTLAAGSKLGPYEILAPLGAGGMGEVYRARDPRLGRDVAIKVSAAQFSERFEREARAIATLNHPHICQIYDVGENYIVMELIDGAPLKGPLRLDTALKYAAQICEALDAAHQKSIVHRDLKPANILATKAGVKLLDFGLAKLGPAAQKTQDVTVTMALTGKNEIVGTLYYMSPEQLQAQSDGRELDSRSDIFSFGLVLYEILTGKRAMEGSSAASVIAAIMERPAPSVGDAAPPGLDRVLKRCLEKDPQNRWQSALDVKAALELVHDAPAPGAPAPKPNRWPWAAAAAMAAVAAVFAGLYLSAPQPRGSQQVVRFQIPVLPSQGLRPLATIAPNGLSLAYFDALEDGRLGLKIRAVGSGAVRDFPDAEMAQPTLLFWKPDSSTVYFGNRRFLRRMEVSQGVVQNVCECTSDSGTVNQDGILLLGATPGRPGIIRVSPGGAVTTLRPGTNSEATPTQPAFLPDGQRFLYKEGEALFVASLDRPQESRLLASAPGQFALAPGFLLVAQPNGLDAFPFDVEKAEIGGPAVNLPLSGSDVRNHLSVSQDGLLVRLLDVESGQDLVWFDAQGKRAGQLGRVEGYAGIDLSHDGDRLAVIEGSQTLGGFRIRDVARGTTTRLAPSLRPEGTVLWSPDDTSVVFVARDRKRGHRLYHADANSTRPESLLLDEPGLHWPNDWSRDGKYLLYGFDEGKTNRDLWALAMEQPGAKPFQVTHGNALIKQGAFSPDTAYIAYTSDESGRYELYVQPFPDVSKGKWVISTEGGTEPIWSRDGRRLYFFSGQRMMYADVRTAGGSFTASAPQELFSAPVPSGYSNDSHRWQLSADGTRFLIMVPSSGAATAYIDVIVNWEGLLKP